MILWSSRIRTLTASPPLRSRSSPPVSVSFCHSPHCERLFSQRLVTEIVPPRTLEAKEPVGKLARGAVLSTQLLPLWLRREQGDSGDNFVHSAGNLVRWGEAYDGHGGSADSK
jgi:hypothetical protein